MPNPPVTVEKYIAYAKEFVSKRCVDRRPLWEAAIAEALAAGNLDDTADNRRLIANQLADIAEKDVIGLDGEVTLMLNRSSTIIAGASLVLVAFVLKSVTHSSIMVTIGKFCLGGAAMLTLVAFLLALIPMTPPLRRAWLSAYERREYRSALLAKPFERWVWFCWMGERRTRVITPYKKCHSVGVRLLVLAAILAVPGLGLLIIFG